MEKPLISSSVYVRLMRFLRSLIESFIRLVSRFLRSSPTPPTTRLGAENGTCSVGQKQNFDNDVWFGLKGLSPQEELFLAAQAGDVRRVEMLLSSGLNVNTVLDRDFFGKAPKPAPEKSRKAGEFQRTQSWTSPGSTAGAMETSTVTVPRINAATTLDSKQSRSRLTQTWTRAGSGNRAGVSSSKATASLTANTQDSSQSADLKSVKPVSPALNLFKEEIALAGFDPREFTSPFEPSDHFLSRWLIARNNNVADALNLLKADIEWRKVIGLMDIRQQAGSEVLGCDEIIAAAVMPQVVHGCDKVGRPVVYIRGLTYNIDKMLEYSSHEQLVRYHVWRKEQLMNMIDEHAQKCGIYHGQLTSVVDIQGMTYAVVTQNFLTYFKEIAALDQSHYPERMAQCFIINVPYVFWMVWAMLKPWLNKNTVNKIQIFAGNYRSALLEYVDPSQLPEEYGGTNGSLVKYYEQVFQKACLLGVNV